MPTISSNELNRLSLAVGRVVKTIAGATVTYHRGNASVSVTAARGRSSFNTDDGYGASIQVVSHDWLIDKADLLISGSVVEPEAGDQIKFNDGGRVRVYEVMTPPYSPSGSTEVRYRIHSKFLKTE
jgi:hypothetical protein